MNNELDIAKHYQKYFYSVKADTPELRKIAYQLRYQVFIEESKFNFHSYNMIDHTEKDEYDDDALHTLLFHKPTKQAIGYVRLIPFKQRFEMLPMEKYGKTQVYNDVDLVETLRSQKTGEISRMCLLSSFRQRKFEQIYLAGMPYTDNSNERRFPINYLALCLTLMSINLVFEANLDHSVAMMEKPLTTLIGHYGIQYRQIGKFTEYCGHRAPYVFLTQHCFDNFNLEVLELYKVIGKELEVSAHALC